MFFFTLAAKILVTTGSATTSEILYVYMKTGKVSFVISKPVKRFPNGNCIGAFGGICEGRIIVGFEKNVFEYLYKEDEWRQVQKEQDVQHDRTGAKCCSIGDGLLVVSPNLKNNAELVRFTKGDQEVNSRISLTSESISHVLHSECKSHISDDNKSAATTKYSSKETSATNTRLGVQSRDSLRPQTLCVTPLPVKIRSCVLTNIGNNQVLLIECNSQLKSKAPQCFIGSLVQMDSSTEKHPIDSVMWSSSLSPDMIRPSNDWPDVSIVSSMNRRYDYIIFKMGRCVYITGGFSATDRPLLSCVYYDLVLKSWYTCKYSMPYHMCGASVVVSADETFAIITGGKKVPGEPKERCSDEIILFTEDDGFQVLRNCSLMRKRSSHVSILLP